jgi:hypothetical protein
VDDDRAAEIALQLAVVGELSKLLRQVAVRRGCGVLFGEDERHRIRRSAAPFGDLDLELSHRGAMVSRRWRRVLLRFYE